MTKNLLLSIILSFFLAGISSAQMTEYKWINSGESDWMDGGSWLGGAVPIPDTNSIICVDRGIANFAVPPGGGKSFSFYIGQSAGETGTVKHSGGPHETGNLYIGIGPGPAIGHLYLSGGSITAGTKTYVGAMATGYLHISDSGSFQTKDLSVGENGGTGTVNLAGGTMTTTGNAAFGSTVGTGIANFSAVRITATP